MKNSFLKEMQDRGYLNQCTNLDKLGKFVIKNQYPDTSVLIALPVAYMLAVYYKL